MDTTILIIAASDSCAGAGVEIDLKCAAAHGVHGTCAITGVTAQNTYEVTAIQTIDPAVVRAQIDAVFADMPPAAIKIGMLGDAAVAQTVADALAAHPDVPVVLDPVLVATSGATLTQASVFELVRDTLIPRATLVTPNIPEAGELTPALIKRAFGVELPQALAPCEDLPPRPPSLCAGCPHRLVFTVLRDMKAIVSGDIGCYTLGATAPLNAVHSTIDMGASLSVAHGLELADVPVRNGRPVVGVIGDSTFAHSGITSMLGTIYNAGAGTLCILDNRTTAMTGCQGNPCNGITLYEQVRGANPLAVERGKRLDIEALCLALGADEVETVDAQDYAAVKDALKRATGAADKLSVLVFRSPCRLVDRSRDGVAVVDDCRACGKCVRIGCPAIGKDDEGHATIDPAQCIGCAQCIQVCPFGCIAKEGE